MRGETRKRSWRGMAFCPIGALLVMMFCLYGVPAVAVSAAGTYGIDTATAEGARDTGDGNANSAIVNEVRAIIKSDYPLEIPSEVMTAESISEMLEALGDPYAHYMSGEEFTNLMSGINMTFVGIGVVLEAHGEGVVASQVLPGSPAAEAGLLPGDVIVGANGVDFKGMNWQESASLLKGEDGTLVDLRYFRGSETLTARIERRPVRIPQVTGEVIDTVGYLEVSSFGLGMEKEFQETVLALRQQGAQSWIIDLSDNGGGLVDSALEMLGFFIGEQEAVIWQTSTEKSAERALHQTISIDEPVIILANNMTASASEIVIGALHDYDKAVVLGGNTYGSGRFKQIYALSNGDYFMMTITHFFTPKETPVDFVGLAPDIQLSDEDALTVAKLLLKSGSVETGEDATGYLQWQIGAQTFRVSLDEWRKKEHWRAGQELIDQSVGTMTVSVGNAQGWQLVSEEELVERWPVYFPGYRLLCKQDIDQSGATLVQASLPDSLRQNIGQNIGENIGQDIGQNIGQDVGKNVEQAELIDASNGQRVQVSYRQHEQGLEIIPQQSLSPNQTYWLVIADGHGQGVVAVLKSREIVNTEGFNVDLGVNDAEIDLL